MHYKSYPTKKDTKSRMTRKQSRRSIFWYNVKLAKTLRKSRRLARQEQSETSTD